MPLDSHPEFARLLGIMIERWSILEGTLATALACMIDGNDQAARTILYTLNATGNRIAMVKAVARAVVPDGPERRGLIWLLDRIHDLQQERNKYVHGQLWHATHATGLDLFNFRPTTATPETIERISVRNLEEHVRKVDEAEFQLSLAIDPDPQRNVPPLMCKRRKPSHTTMLRVEAMASFRGAPPPPPQS